MIQFPVAIREPECAKHAREKRKRIAIVAASIFAILSLMFCEYRYIMLNLSPSVSENGTVYIEIFGQTDAYNVNGNICTAVGAFYGDYEAIDQDGLQHKYYQFESHNGEVIWSLSVEEIGGVPMQDREYILTYDNSGTTKANKPCNCPPEYECECEVYDDIFLNVKENKE